MTLFGRLGSKLKSTLANALSLETWGEMVKPSSILICIECTTAGKRLLSGRYYGTAEQSSIISCGHADPRFRSLGKEAGASGKAHRAVHIVVREFARSGL